MAHEHACSHALQLTSTARWVTSGSMMVKMLRACVCPDKLLWSMATLDSTTSALFRWEEEEVNRRLDKAMTDAFAGIWDIHSQKRIPLRVAAFHIALQRVTRALMNRGFD